MECVSQKTRVHTNFQQFLLLRQHSVITLAQEERKA